MWEWFQGKPKGHQRETKGKPSIWGVPHSHPGYPPLTGDGHLSAGGVRHLYRAVPDEPATSICLTNMVSFYVC